jgi:hypothetical protein
VAEGTELMQKEVLRKIPMQLLEPPHTPQSSTVLPLLQKIIQLNKLKAI